MEVHDPETPKSHPSYLVGDDGGREKVINLVALSINQAEVMRGRATLVWRATRNQAIDTDEIQMFAVKRYWHPYGPKQTGSLSYLPEGDRYRRVPSWEERIYSSEDIKINDIPDSTLEFQLYYGGFIFHRDISIENILIIDSDGQTKGRLIDLDHAKVVESPKTMKMCNASLEQVERVNLFLSDFRPIDHKVIKKVVGYFLADDPFHAATYIRDVVECREQHFGLESDHGISLADKEVKCALENLRGEPSTG
ncbi:hypothetical protein F5887DRAFT_1076402 [Amanita rubescens]|nr:hypothetical protein F5887DRAFT_1076402 [Amanita rubescens]